MQEDTRKLDERTSREHFEEIYDRLDSLLGLVLLLTRTIKSTDPAFLETKEKLEKIIKGDVDD